MSSGILDFLFQGQPPASVTNSATSTTTVPDWMQEYIKADLSKASGIAGQDYQQYTGPRVAALTADQNQAYSNVAANQGNWQPALTQAQQQTTAASNPALDNSTFQSYMSPYTSGIVDNIAQMGQRNLTENLLPAVNSTFTGSGQWGSSRHADFTNNAVRDENQTVLQQQNAALQSAYDSAMSNYQTGQNRALSGAAQTGQLAQQQQTQGLQDAAALEAAGQAQQQNTQQNYDTAYQDFIDQRDYGKNNVNWISSLLNGVPQQSSTTSTSTGPASTYAPSGLANIAGSLSLLNGLKLKKGGMVPGNSSYAPALGGQQLARFHPRTPEPALSRWRIS